MSGNDTSIVPIAPPPGLNFIEAIRPSLTLLLIGATWSSSLVPLVFALFLFSTKSLRRTPIFILNFLGICLGLALGILNYVIEVGAILDPLHPGPTSYLIAFGVLICVVPFLVESILIVRVFAVYPLRTLPKLHAVAIYGPIAAFKIARLINYALFWHTWFPLLTQPGNPVQLSQEAWNRPYQKIEWFLQVFDCGFVSMLFLWRLRAGRKVAGTNHRVKKSKASYYSMINSLFWIAISNFVFPVLLSIAQLVFAFVDSSYLDGAYVLLCNLYVSIIGVLLATIWSAGSKWTSPSPNSTQADSGMHLSTFRMAPVAVNVSHFTEITGSDGSDTRVSEQNEKSWKSAPVPDHEKSWKGSAV